MFNPLKYFRNRKVGLVLGSGGAKGIAHIAVIEAMEGKKVPISMVSGASIGALIGAIYCEGNLQAFKKSLLEMDKKTYRDFFEPMIPVTGLIGTDTFMKYLGSFIPPTRNIEDLKIPLRIVATDFKTGQPVVFSSGNVLQAIRASISIPGVFTPVSYLDTFLIDGGVANPLPIDVVKDMGAGLVIAVNLHPEIKERKTKKQKITEAPKAEEKQNKKDLPEPVSFLLDKVKSAAEFGKAAYLKYLGDKDMEKEEKKKTPNIFETMFQTIDIMGYSNSVLMLKYCPPNILIEPNLLHFGSLDFNKAAEALEEGRKSFEKIYPEFKNIILKWI